MRIYRNGNYLVRISEDGSKSYTTFIAWEDYKPEFPDSLDVKITNRCSGGCPFCHENSNPEGKDADLDRLEKVLYTLPEHTPIEIALGGGNICEFGDIPKLVKFISGLKSRGFNISITQNIENISAGLLNIIPYLNSMGLSIENKYLVKSRREELEKIIKSIEEVNPRIKLVSHFILGVTDLKLLRNFIIDSQLHRELSSLITRILFLGYKTFGRGKDWEGGHIDRKLKSIKEKVVDLMTDRRLSFRTTYSFDNLAISQLQLKNLISHKLWEEQYMGDEFSHSMYIDAVNEIFAPNSTAPTEERKMWLDYSSIPEYFKNHRPHGEQ